MDKLHALVPIVGGSADVRLDDRLAAAAGLRALARLRAGSRLGHSSAVEIVPERGDILLVLLVAEQAGVDAAAVLGTAGGAEHRPSAVEMLVLAHVFAACAERARGDPEHGGEKQKFI